MRPKSLLRKELEKAADVAANSNMKRRFSLKTKQSEARSCELRMDWLSMKDLPTVSSPQSGPSEDP